MPAGPDETDDHPVGAVMEHVMKNSSSKTDNNASTHPLHDKGPPKGEKVELRHDDDLGSSKSEDKHAHK